MKPNMSSICFFLFLLLTFSNINSQTYQWEYFDSDSTVNEWINGILVEANNTKWVATYGNGISKYENNTWTRYDESNSELPSSLVWNITSDKQNIKWISCGNNSGALVKYDGQNFTIFNTSNSGLPNSHVFTVEFDKNGLKWIATLFGGIASFDDSTWQTYNTSNSQIPSNEIISLAIDSLNNKWIGTWFSGLAKFDGISWKTYNTTNSPLLSNKINDIEVDSENNIWFATRKGLYKLANDSIWTVYDSNNSPLNDYEFNTVRFDKNGTLWVGSIRKNLFVNFGNTWKEIGVEQGMQDSSALCLAFDNNDVWVGTWNSGISVMLDGINVVDIENRSGNEIVGNFNLFQNYPNPFNPSTEIKFSIPQNSHVKLELFNALGEKVATLINEEMSAGLHNYQLSISNYQLSSGVYFYKLQSGNFTETKKMLLLK